MYTKKLAGLVVASTLLSACGGTPSLPTPPTNAPVVTPSTTPTTPAVTSTPQTTDKNPGTSLNPIDKGKTLSSDTFRYTLLDVREDQVEYYGSPVHVLLVKLEVENIIKKDKNLSILEARLLKDKADAAAGQNGFSPEFMYLRSYVGTDLGGDVSVLHPGEKVTGYYIYQYQPYSKLFFNIYNLGINPETGETTVIEKILTKAGTFNIK